jgi:predicted membrane channel-forming protein YqfA (hemolysin III family)
MAMLRSFGGEKFENFSTQLVDTDTTRSVLFATFFASGFVPMVHASIIDGVEVLGYFPLAHTIGMASFYGTGVLFYVTRFPEKYFPEKFDIWVRVFDSNCYSEYPSDSRRARATKSSTSLS